MAALLVVAFVILLSIYIAKAHTLYHHDNHNQTSNTTEQSPKILGYTRPLQYVVTIFAVFHGSVNIFRLRHMVFISH
jgi:hypothetical protein